MIETAPGGIATQIDGVPVTRDAFLGGCLQLYQPVSGYRAGIDAVLLAASVRLQTEGARARLVDFGAGVGTVGLCAARRLESVNVDLIERVAPLSEISRRNILENGLSDRVRPVHCDLLASDAQTLIPTEAYDQALANPPFYETGAVRAAADPLKAQSHGGRREELDGWFRCLARVLKPGGLVTMVHMPNALGKVLACCEGRFGAVQIIPVYPRMERDAIRILIRAQKGSRAAPGLGPGLILHGDGHAFRPEISEILGQPRALDIWS